METIGIATMTCPNPPAAAPASPHTLVRWVLLLAGLMLAALITWAVGRAEWSIQSLSAAQPSPPAEAAAAAAPGAVGAVVSTGPVRGVRIPCVSYAPFRREGHSPFDPALRLSGAELRDDLRQLATVTDCVRLYGVGHGLDQVPAIAREIGLRVVLGAWIDRDEVASRRELDRALALAREYPDVVRMLVVGNEVLLRQERRPEDLAALLQATRAVSPVPVAYADVWEFWLRHAAVLTPAVDIAAIHLLPYWEDEPVGLSQAVDHVLRLHDHVRARLGPLPVWVAETGWPSLGRQRGPAIPGVREQAAFVRGLLTQAPAAGLDYNLIEGFDQPWKRALEGAMGGAWGLFDARAQARDPHGPGGRWPPDPVARWTLAGAMAGFLVGLLALTLPTAMSVRATGQAGGPTALERLCRLVIACLCGALLAHHLSTATAWVRHGHEALMAGACVAAVVWMAAMAWAPTGGQTGVEGRMTQWARHAVLLLMATSLLPLALDGRYRPLPWSLWAIPAMVVMWSAAARPLHHPARTVGLSETLLARLILLAAAGLTVSEGLANRQAMGVAVGAAITAGVSLWEARRWGRHRAAADARAAAHAPATTAQADASAS